MTDKQRLKAFEDDLKVLLKKHKAHLSVVMEGDTYGIYEDYVGVDFSEPFSNDTLELFKGEDI